MFVLYILNHLYMYSCMYVCIEIYIHVSVFLCILDCIHAYGIALALFYVCILFCINVFLKVCRFIGIYLYMYECFYVCTSIRLHFKISLFIFGYMHFWCMTNSIYKCTNLWNYCFIIVSFNEWINDLFKDFIG